MSPRIPNLPRPILLVAAFLTLTTVAHAAPINVAVLHADTAFSSTNVQSQLLSTGLFAAVDLIDISNPGSTPTLVDLSGYDAVLAYTNFAPDDATALGDVLADFVDAGHGVVLGGYGLGDVSTVGGSTMFAGRITQSGYSPLVVSASLTDLDGALNVLAPVDPVFTGVDTAAPDFYYHDAFFANPSLDLGATLLATDGAGVNILARNANGRVIGMNLFPGIGAVENSDAFYRLLGNSLVSVGSVPSVPEPSAAVLAAQGLLLPALAALIRFRRRSRRA